MASSSTSQSNPLPLFILTSFFPAPAITTFSPIQQPSGSITKLIPGLSTFTNLNTSSVSKPSKIGAVPVYSDRVSQVARHQRQAVKQEDGEDGEGDVKLDVAKTQEYELKHFKELKVFKPQGLKDQLCEVVVTGVKVNNSCVEQILNEVVEVSYEWSFIDEGGEKKIVFVRFIDDDLAKNAKQIKRFIGVHGVVVNEVEWEVNVEENTEKFIKDVIKVENIDLDELNGKISKILSNSMQVWNGDNFADYQVDESELHDLPPESLPQLRKDIKEFRLKVLENEKRKRERESLEEMKRSKVQLRKLFDRFKNEENQMLEDDEDEESEDDESEDEDDEQYEISRIEKENQLVLQKYKELMKVVGYQEYKNKELIEDLEVLRQYEVGLDKSLHPEYELGKFKPSNRDKLLELEQDEKDRQQESRELEVVKQSENFLNSINIPLKKKSVGLDGDELEQVLERIKPKVEGYIEEFLGVKEDELLEYILMIIKEHQDKQELVKELKETFDEDAVKIGDLIWGDFESESRGNNN